MRFRDDPIVITAGIESMFSQVPQADADLLRFLRWPDGDHSGPMIGYRTAVHIFGATWSVASYALQRMAEDRKDTAAPEAVEAAQFSLTDSLARHPLVMMQDIFLQPSSFSP